MTKLACQTITWGEPRLKSDYPGVLKDVSDIGYAGVETKFAILHQYCDDLADLKRSTGLSIITAHLGMDQVREAVAAGAMAEAIERVIEASGLRFLLVSDHAHDDLDQYREMGEVLTRFSERVSDYNVRVLYHNHRKEVEGDMGRLGALTDHSAADRVGLAMDFGWVLQAGTDPVRVVERFGARIGYVHLKDAKDGVWTELGHGDLPVDTVIRAIRPLDLPWWTAEQDTTSRTAAESARMNHDFLAPLLKV